MRHNNRGRKLGRTASHRRATLKALATSLLKYKRIKTTVAKAKETRPFVEGLITKAKTDSVQARRYVAQFVNDKAAVQELFSTIIEKVGDRPGGYTRVVKLGQRLGDAAEMAILELVDFNEIANKKAVENKDKKEKAKEAKAEKAAKEQAEAEEANVVSEESK
jgi:large subunit ribosomal protein L17